MTLPTLTPRLAKALEAWVSTPVNRHPSAWSQTRELVEAYREALAAEPDAARFEVGQAVAHEMGGKGRVVDVMITYLVVTEDGTQMCWGQNEMKSVPDLPPDHIDRFWIVGAWIQHAGQTFVVISDDAAFEITSAEAGDEPVWTPNKDALLQWSPCWSFHESSPIKEERTL